MPVNVNISFNKQNFLARFAEANSKALKAVMPQMIADCNKYAPDDQHILKRSAETHSRVIEAFGSTELRLVWSTPYARYLYYGYLMIDPQTRSSWAREGVRKVRTLRLLTYSQTYGPAGRLWCEKARQKHIKAWEAIYANKLKKEMQT